MPDCFQSSPRICKVFLKIVLKRSSRQHALHEENVTHTEVSALSLCQMPSLFTWATSEAIQKRQPAPAWERKCCFKWRWFTWSGGCPQRKAREMANDTHKGRKCPPPPRGTAAPGDTPLWRGGRGSQQSCKADQQSGEADTHEKAEGKKKLVLRTLVVWTCWGNKNWH